MPRFLTKLLLAVIIIAVFLFAQAVLNPLLRYYWQNFTVAGQLGMDSPQRLRWGVGLLFGNIISNFLDAKSKQSQEHLASDSATPKRLVDLPQKPSRWVSSIEFDDDSKAYICVDGLDITQQEASYFPWPKKISVGDNVFGLLEVGAIRCVFHKNDAFRREGSDLNQFMWRGRWSAILTRSRKESENTVKAGYDYICISPVTLKH